MILFTCHGRQGKPATLDWRALAALATIWADGRDASLMGTEMIVFVFFPQDLGGKDGHSSERYSYSFRG